VLTKTNKKITAEIFFFIRAEIQGLLYPAHANVGYFCVVSVSPAALNTV
jgi:hypothetical protein